MLSARMESVAACLLCERTQQHRTLHRVPRNHELLPDREVLARLLLGPGGGSRRERLQRGNTMLVASHTPRVAKALLKKNRLYPFFEKCVIERRSSWRRAGPLSEQQYNQQDFQSSHCELVIEKLSHRVYARQHQHGAWSDSSRLRPFPFQAGSSTSIS